MLPLLENLAIDDIREEHILALVGREENQTLEFKELYPSNDAGRKKIAKSVCSFANSSGGGFVVVGAVVGKDKATCIGLANVPDVQAVQNQILHVCTSGNITPIVENLSIRNFRIPGGTNVVVVYVPPSPSAPHGWRELPHKPVYFWVRHGTETPLMDYFGLRNKFLTHHGAFDLLRIEKKVDGIAELLGTLNEKLQEKRSAPQPVVKPEPPPVRPVVLPRKEFTADEPERWHEITDPNELFSFVDGRFKKKVADRRFFRLTATPLDLGKLSIDLGDKAVVDKLERPVDQRKHGWNVEPIPPITASAIGFESANTKYHFVWLMRNGHLEFWTEIDDSFCWMQDEAELARHPRFYPYAVTEYPVSFLRLAKDLYRHLGVSGKVFWRMQYYNIQGCYMSPYHPEAVGFRYPMNPPKLFEKPELLLDATLEPDFAPDRSAFDRIKEVYYRFGYQEKHIPFFNENREFIVK
jgi:hypothetical protein